MLYSVQLTPYYLTEIYFLSTPLKQKSTNSLNTLINFLYGILVSSVETSKHDTEIALLRLLRLLMELITGLLLKIVQQGLIPEKKKLCLL